MIFVLFLPGYWTSSHSAQHLIVAAFYATGLVGVAACDPATASTTSRTLIRSSRHSSGSASTWPSICKLSSLDLLGHWWGGTQVASEFAKPFYWTTWVMIWCLPPVVLVRGIRQKDRFVIAVGAITAILTFVSNKPYLGWQRHTWDPMLLGILLTGVVCLRPTLARPWPGRNSPRLYRCAPIGKGKTLD